MDEKATIFTVGYSGLNFEVFLTLLRSKGITAIADVRTAPYSSYFPAFNQDILASNLQANGIQYVFLGRELGGRPNRPEFYCDGVADYEKMSLAEGFQSGLGRVLNGTRSYTLALMCSEKSPLDCHRCLLVGRALRERSVLVEHLLHDGSVCSQDDIDAILLKEAGLEAEDFFYPRQQRLAIAYKERAAKVAFSALDLSQMRSA